MNQRSNKVQQAISGIAHSPSWEDCSHETKSILRQGIEENLLSCEGAGGFTITKMLLKLPRDLASTWVRNNPNQIRFMFHAIFVGIAGDKQLKDILNHINADELIKDHYRLISSALEECVSYRGYVGMKDSERARYDRIRAEATELGVGIAKQKIQSGYKAVCTQKA